jgi:hypothetical protein
MIKSENTKESADEIIGPKREKVTVTWRKVSTLAFGAKTAHYAPFHIHG